MSHWASAQISSKLLLSAKHGCANIHPPSPYKLEASWDAFEFGFHVLEAQANVVIMTMAWQTHQDAESFNCTPQEPDLETLVYWVQRLEPLIRADKDEEIIVVFCNRTGTEGDATYTGTSAVLGIKRGEVFVYGLLGRGVSGLLMVDTSQPPRSKLADANAVDGGHLVEKKTSLDTGAAARKPPPRLPPLQVPYSMLADEHEECQCHLADHGASPLSPRFGSPRSATSPRLGWLAHGPQPGGTPTDSRSPTRLQIPTRPQLGEYTAIDSAMTDDVIIDTPAMPNTPGFARRALRSQLAAPASPWRFPGKASPYPWSHHDGSRSALFGGGAAMTPITPFDEDGWSATPIDPKGPPQWFWRHEPTLTALKESVVEEEEEEEEEEEKEKEKKEEQDGPSGSSQIQPEPLKQEDGRELAPGGPQETPGADPGSQPQADQEVAAPGEPLSDEEPEPEPLSDWAELTQVLEGLRGRPSAAFDFGSGRPQDRPCSPKSRYLSRDTSPFRLFQPSELDYDDWEPAAPEAGENPDFSSEAVNERPASRKSRRSIPRSDSSDSTLPTRRKRRGPSRLRHAVYFADDADTEDSDDDDEQEEEPFADQHPEPSIPLELPYPYYRHSNDSNNNNPPKKQNPPASLQLTLPPTTATTPNHPTQSQSQSQPQPQSQLQPQSQPQPQPQPPPTLTLPAVPPTTPTTIPTTTPSLCSTTSATSVSTFSDRHSKAELLELDLEPDLELEEVAVAVVGTTSDLGTWGETRDGEEVVSSEVVVSAVGVVGGVGKGDAGGGGGGDVDAKAGSGSGRGRLWLEGVESVEGWRAGRLGKRATWCG